MREAAKMAMAYGGGYAYCLGDEMTLTSYNAYYDFDFAPASIAAYRRWLQRRYGSMAALNGQWGTRIRGVVRGPAHDRRRGPPAARRQLRTLGRLPHVHGRLAGRFLRRLAKGPGGGGPAGQDQHLRHPGRHGRQRRRLVEALPQPAGAAQLQQREHAVSAPGLRPRGRHAGGAVCEQCLRPGLRTGAGRQHVVGRVLRVLRPDLPGDAELFPPRPDDLRDGPGSQEFPGRSPRRDLAAPAQRAPRSAAHRHPPLPAQHPGQLHSQPRAALPEGPRRLGPAVARQRPAIRLRGLRPTGVAGLSGPTRLPGPGPAGVPGPLGPGGGRDPGLRPGRRRGDRRQQPGLDERALPHAGDGAVGRPVRPVGRPPALRGRQAHARAEGRLGRPARRPADCRLGARGEGRAGEGRRGARAHPIRPWARSTMPRPARGRPCT